MAPVSQKTGPDASLLVRPECSSASRNRSSLCTRYIRQNDYSRARKASAIDASAKMRASGTAPDFCDSPGGSRGGAVYQIDRSRIQLPAHLEATNTACQTPTWRRVVALWTRAIGISVLDGIVDCLFSCKQLRCFFLLRRRNRDILGFSHVYMRKLLLIRQFPRNAMPRLRMPDGFLVRPAEENVAVTKRAMPNVGGNRGRQRAPELRALETECPLTVADRDLRFHRRQPSATETANAQALPRRPQA